MCILSTNKNEKYHCLREMIQLTNAKVSTRNALLKLGFESSDIKRTWPIMGANSNLLPFFPQAPWVKKERLNLLQKIEVDMVEIRQMNAMLLLYQIDGWVVNEWEGMEKSIYQWRYFRFWRNSRVFFAIFSFLNSRENGFLISGRAKGTRRREVNSDRRGVSDLLRKVFRL